MNDEYTGTLILGIVSSILAILSLFVGGLFGGVMFILGAIMASMGFYTAYTHTPAYADAQKAKRERMNALFSTLAKQYGYSSFNITDNIFENIYFDKNKNLLGIEEFKKEESVVIPLKNIISCDWDTHDKVYSRFEYGDSDIQKSVMMQTTGVNMIEGDFVNYAETESYFITIKYYDNNWNRKINIQRYSKYQNLDTIFNVCERINNMAEAIKNQNI